MFCSDLLWLSPLHLIPSYPYIVFGIMLNSYEELYLLDCIFASTCSTGPPRMLTPADSLTIKYSIRLHPVADHRRLRVYQSLSTRMLPYRNPNRWVLDFLQSRQKALRKMNPYRWPEMLPEGGNHPLMDSPLQDHP